MHLIGFSHHYTKLQGQTFGRLLGVRIIQPSVAEVLSNATVYYDSEYIDEHGNYQNAPRDPQENLQLVFIGNKQIPFTTYRKFIKDYSPYSIYHYNGIPYSDLIGENFAFKFKDEPLPEDLSYRVYKDAIRIF